MSKLSAFRNEVDRIGLPLRHRIPQLLAVAVVVTLAVAWLAQMRLLGSFAADDFGFLLFQNG